MDNHDVLIFNQAEALGYKDIDSIQRKGFSVNVSDELTELPQLLKNLQKPILIINSSSGSDIQPFIDSICENSSLKPFPLIFIARKLVGLENQLNKSFPLGLALQHPADPNKIIEALRFISRNYRSAPISTKTETAVSAETTAAIEEADEEISVESISAGIEAARKLFSSIEGSNISKIDLGGADLPLLLSGGHKEKVCSITLPDNPEMQQCCVQFLSKLKTTTRDILERVNIIALKIISPLNFEAEVVETIQAASILYAQAYAGQTRSFLTRPYSYRGAVVLRKEICSAIKDSALNIGGELSNRKLSQVISGVGKIIGQESSIEDEQLYLASSAVVAADLINRNCYQPFFWNLSAAHALLRRIKAGRTKSLHPAITCTMLKLMAEALSSPSNAKILRSQRVQKEKEVPDSSILVYDETLVDVPSLTAGMRLSRPLSTEDGKAVLAEDLLLDDDLILRIWQLSSKKVLNKAVIKRLH